MTELHPPFGIADEMFSPMKSYIASQDLAHRPMAAPDPFAAIADLDPMGASAIPPTAVATS